VNGEAVFVMLEGITDRNAAEILRNKDVEVLRRDTVKLPEGRHFIVDLIGCNVATNSGDAVGQLKEILPYKTAVYRVKMTDGRYLLFPVVDGLIVNTDVQNKSIIVDAKGWVR
jgi:16S rRNA processing protein RimM